MNLDGISNQIYIVALNEAKLQNHEYVTPEHFLYSALMFDTGKKIIENSGGDSQKIIKELQLFLKSNVSKTKLDKPIESYSFIQMFELAAKLTFSKEQDVITLGNLLTAIFSLTESHASYILKKNNVNKIKMINYIESKDSSNKSNLTTDTKKDDDDSDIKFLKRFTENITEKAKNNLLDPIIGREHIIERTIQVLSRRNKNNPIHVGYSGVGKTSIVDALAQKIVSDNICNSLKSAEIFYIDMPRIVAGTKFRGDFEERLIKILEALEKRNNPIVYLDEVHQIVGSGNVSGGTMDATSIIRPFLSNSKIKFIASTNYDDYKKTIEKDKVLFRNFQKIDIDEPTIDETIDILYGIRHKYEEFHNVTFSDETIRVVANLSAKYINDRYLPDKAIDVLDETASFLRLNDQTETKIQITPTDVEKTISFIAKVPPESVSSSDIENLKYLDANLKKYIYGQDHAINDVVNAIKLSRSGLNDYNKPIASLLFVGPTGVGKTEIAKKLSELLSIKLVRFDMSEYQEKHSVSRLIGSPPGYVGFEDGGLLTDEIRKSPHCVLLLDEIEKAHPDILNVLLQVMDYGTLTETSGKKADFKNTIIIMTSNAGAMQLNKNIIGFDHKINDLSYIDKAVEKVFSPEFRNRMDSIIVFNHINYDMAINITKKAFKELEKKLNTKNIELEISDNIIEYMANTGLSEKYGAREIIRIINSKIKKMISEQLLFSSDKKITRILVNYIENNIKIDTLY